MYKSTIVSYPVFMITKTYLAICYWAISIFSLCVALFIPYELDPSWWKMRFCMIYVIVEVTTNRQIIFRFHKLQLKITEISHFFEEKIEKVGV